MSQTIEEILTPKPEARPRIYAYSIADKAHAGHRAKGAPYESNALGIQRKIPTQP